MKNKIKKIIALVELLSTFIVTTIALVGTTVSGDINANGSGNYAWAQKIIKLYGHR